VLRTMGDAVEQEIGVPLPRREVTP